MTSPIISGPANHSIFILGQPNEFHPWFQFNASNVTFAVVPEGGGQLSHQAFQGPDLNKDVRWLVFTPKQIGSVWLSIGSSPGDTVSLYEFEIIEQPSPARTIIVFALLCMGVYWTIILFNYLRWRMETRLSEEIDRLVPSHNGENDA